MMKMSEKVQSFLEDFERPEVSLEQHLASLKASHLQHLQEIQQEHQAELERRMLQNSLLSSHSDSPVKTHGPLGDTCGERRTSRSREPTHMFNKPKRSSSTPDLSSSASRPNPSTPGQAGVSRAALTRSQGTKEDKEEMAWAECQKQFRAVPVPKYVVQPRYDDMVQERARARHEGRQRRTQLLLATQRPFAFQQREEREGRKPRQGSGPEQHSDSRKCVVAKRASVEEVIDPAISEHLKEAEQQRKHRIQVRAQETLRASSAPIQYHRADRPTRTAQRTKSKVLGFLEQEPSFRPKTNTEVPDFDQLYQAFQRRLQERAERRETTLCRPFQLRTSTLQPRLSKSRPDETLMRPGAGPWPYGEKETPERKSLELRDSKEQEDAQWMKQHRMNSEAISRAVVTRARAMDPHQSLKEVYQEKLKQHRQSDQERVKDYKRELREMRARVTSRPYLFEQVSQKNAKSDVERRYRSTLQQAGLDEDFVKSKGENDERQTSKNKDADSHSEGDDHSSDSDTQQREGRGQDSRHRSEEGKQDNAEPQGEDVS